jgi:GrpB-like predicted nucleotidyltransferase (UPF0157 family)
MVVVPYDEKWPERFDLIKAVLDGALSRAISIEHIGSTSIPGMCAKPVIDVDVVIRDGKDLPLTTEELSGIGYIHAGDQGIPGREVFKRSMQFRVKHLDEIKHHLYVCMVDSSEYSRHIMFRNYLRKHADKRDEYNRIKQEILHKYGEDNREGYVFAKENEYNWFFADVIARAEKEKH